MKKDVIIYNGTAEGEENVTSKTFTPLFIFLFVLPLIFIYLFEILSPQDTELKLGLLIVLELITWIFDYWVKISFRTEKLYRIWLIEMPLVFLVYLALYLSF